MQRRAFVLGAVFALALLPNAARTQDDCTEGHVCVDYGASSTVEIDPSLGFLQSIVVEERKLTITDFDGTTTQLQVKVATFVADGDAYQLAREDIVPQDGSFADAALNDVFILSKAQ